MPKISSLYITESNCQTASLVVGVCQRKRKYNEIVRNGHNYAGHQVFRFMCCGKQFVETLGTPFYGKRLPEKEIIGICKLLVEKNGVRSIERITGHHRDTISNLLKDMAEHAEMMKSLRHFSKFSSFSI